jgi:hypothetical protein
MGKIVWIASYPKSGNTWMRAFLWNYFRLPGRQTPLEDLSRFAVSESHPERYQRFARDGDPASLSYEQLAGHRSQVHASIAAAASGTTFVKAHNFLGALDGHALYNLNVTSGAIYIVRNPLDVVVSMSDHFGLSLDEAIDFIANEETAGPTNEIAVAEFYSSWSTHVASWTTQQHPNFRVLRYEDMLERPQKAFLSVLKLINQPNNPARLKAAIKASTFKQLREREAKSGFGERSEHSRRFFRVGRKNQWRELLSPEQVERIVERHETQMRRFGYVPKFLDAKAGC